MPTAAAIVYGRDVSRSLDILQRASMQFASNPNGGAFSLAILPAFGTRWLSPRLNAFLVKHPGITVHLATRLRRFDFDTEAASTPRSTSAPPTGQMPSIWNFSRSN